jgi:hypothetical protein
MTDYAAVLTRRYAGKEWWISGNDYATLEWTSAGTKPTQASLDSLWAEVEAEIIAEPATKAAAKNAVLAKLGLTADEVAALLS